VMTVHGLSCPLCSHNIDGVLKQLDDVEEVAVDLSTGEVVVDLAAGHTVSAAQLAEAVADAGFTVKSIRGR
jgi:copper chaperone CopZ